MGKTGPFHQGDEDEPKAQGHKQFGSLGCPVRGGTWLQKCLWAFVWGCNGELLALTFSGAWTWFCRFQPNVHKSSAERLTFVSYF